MAGPWTETSFWAVARHGAEAGYPDASPGGGESGTGIAGGDSGHGVAIDQVVRDADNGTGLKDWPWLYYRIARQL